MQQLSGANKDLTGTLQLDTTESRFEVGGA